MVYEARHGQTLISLSRPYLSGGGSLHRFFLAMQVNLLLVNSLNETFKNSGFNGSAVKVRQSGWDSPTVAGPDYRARTANDL